MHLETSKSQDAKAINPKEIEILFKEVALLIENGDFIEQDTIETLHTNLKNKIDSKELRLWRDLMDEFDFDEALNIMKKWDIFST